MVKVKGTVDGEKIKASYDPETGEFKFSKRFVREFYFGEQGEFDGLLPGNHYVGTDIKENPWVFVGVMKLFTDDLEITDSSGLPPKPAIPEGAIA